MLALFCAIVILTPMVLYAHALLKKSAPSANAVLEHAPNKIELWFTEAVELSGTHVTLVAPNGHEIPLAGLAFPGADHADVVATVPDSLAAGKYTVQWHAAAADDGHPSSGSFAFTVQGTAVAPVPVAAPSSSPLPTAASDDSVGGMSPVASRVVRWMEFMALIVLLGACVFRQFVLPRSGISNGAADRRVRMIGAMAVAALLVTMIIRAHMQSVIFGFNHPGDNPLAISTDLFHTSWGRGWLIGLVGLSMCVVGLTAPTLDTGFQWVVANGGAVALAVYPALTGHAMANSALRIPSVIVDALHVSAVGAWIGMLFFVAIVGIPLILRGGRDQAATRVATLVTAFHPIALASVITLALTGALSACLHLGSFNALFTSDYGQVVMIKVAGFGLIALRGAYSWLVTTPKLAQGTTNALTQIRRSIAVEVVLGALVLALSAKLVSVPPPAADATIPSASSASGSPSR